MSTNAVQGSSVAGSWVGVATQMEINDGKLLPISNERIQDAMVHSIVSSHGNTLDKRQAPTPEKRLEIVQQAMSLQRSTASPISHAPDFKLGLTKQELKLIDDMFVRWALTDRLCLLELWGLDLYTDLVQLGKYLPKEAMIEIVKRYSGYFAVGYVSFMTEHDKKNWPVEIEFRHPGVKPKNAVFVCSRRYWVDQLTQIEEALQKLSSTKRLLPTISATLQQVKKKIDLGERLLLHPEASTLLIDFNLFAHAGHFPKAKSLLKSSPQKTLESLTQYTQFIRHSFDCSVELGYLGLQLPILHRMAEAFAKLMQEEKYFQAVKRIKKDISPIFFGVYEMIQQLKAAIPPAKCGKLSSKEFWRAQGVKTTTEKNSHEFTSQLHVQIVTLGTALQFFYDFFEILDQEIMEPLFPDLFVPTTACCDRFNINTGAMILGINDLVLHGLNQRFPVAQIPLAAPQEKLLHTVLGELRLNLHRPLFEIQPAQFFAWSHNWQMLNQCEKVQYHLWLPVIDEMRPVADIAAKMLDSLDAHRKMFLGEIEKFLRSLDPKELSAQREIWTHYFKEYVFEESLLICRIIMIAQDIKALSQLHVNSNVVNSEEHLLPPELVTFMLLEGIDGVFNKVLYPHQQPMGEANNRPVRTQEKVDAVAKPLLVVARSVVRAEPSSSLSLTETPNDAPEPFRVISGEKVRELLDRLRQRGFAIIRTKGSHHQVSDGKITVTVPHHRDLPDGTAHSIADRVNRKQKGKKR